MVSGNRPGESNALQVQIPCIVFFVVAPIFVTIRIWTRIKLKSGLGYDDWTILCSFGFSLIVSALMMASCAYGFGQHNVNLSVYNRKMTLKLFYVAQAFYKLTINLTKASILLLYLRIFVQKPFRILCYFMLGVILSYMVATFFAAVFQCTPIPRAWDKTIEGTCISIPQNWYANAGFSIATDFIILVLPMPIIYKSHLALNQKMALMFVFALGAFVMITSIFHDIASSLWTIVEENVGIICACLPSCRPLLSILLPSVFPPNSANASDESNSRRLRDGTFVHAGTGKNEWIPSRGDKDAMGINLTTVEAGGLDGNTSEESILRRHDVLSDRDSNGIHKVTSYHVS